MEGFRHDAHPMGMLLSTVGALSTFYPDAKKVCDKKCRDHHITRLISKMPTIAAFTYRHTIGFPYVYPDNELSYTGNFLSMMKKMAEPTYKVDPVLERALDVSSSSTRTTSRTARRTRCAPSAPPRPIRTRASRRRRPHSTDRSTAARTRPSSRCSTRSATSRTSPRS